MNAAIAGEARISRIADRPTEYDNITRKEY